MATPDAEGTALSTLVAKDLGELLAAPAPVSVPVKAPAPTRSRTRAAGRLAALVGMTEAKAVLSQRVEAAAALVRSGVPLAGSADVVLSGPRGHGRSVLARRYACCLVEAGALRSGQVARTSLAALWPDWPGQSARLFAAALDEAVDGTLLLDVDDWPGDGPADESPDALGQIATALDEAFADRQADLAVVLVGEPARLAELFAARPALRSRLRTGLDVPEYTVDEMVELACRRLSGRGYPLPGEVRDAVASLVAERGVHSGAYAAHRMADWIATRLQSWTPGLATAAVG
jgi:hypothetical protein